MTSGDVRVDAFDGRALETTWDFDAGYFWFDQLERVGYFYDKVLAIQVLTDPTTYFLGRDTDADIRRYQLNFASTFGPSMGTFFGSLLSEEWDHIAPRASGWAKAPRSSSARSRKRSSNGPKVRWPI